MTIWTQLLFLLTCPSVSAAISRKQIEQLAVVSMGGVAAETLILGNAKGGVADLRQLDSLMKLTSPELSKQMQQDLVRWSFCEAYTILASIRGSSSCSQRHSSSKRLSESASLGLNRHLKRIWRRHWSPINSQTCSVAE